MLGKRGARRATWLWRGAAEAPLALSLSLLFLSRSLSPDKGCRPWGAPTTTPRPTPPPGTRPSKSVRFPSFNFAYFGFAALFWSVSEPRDSCFFALGRIFRRRAIRRLQHQRNSTRGGNRNRNRRGFNSQFCVD